MPMIFVSRPAFLNALAMPVIVPPVPIPRTMASILFRDSTPSSLELAQADNIASGGFQFSNLAHGGVDIRCLDVQHGLDGNRSISAYSGLPHFDLLCFAPIDFFVHDSSLIGIIFAIYERAN